MVHVDMRVQKVADVTRLEAVLAQLVFERLLLRPSRRQSLVRQSIFHRAKAAVDQNGPFSALDEPCGGREPGIRAAASLPIDKAGVDFEVAKIEWMDGKGH